MCENAIKQIPIIIDYKFTNDNMINKHYPILLLTQAYNEEKNVKDFLENTSKFVDGIIVLDDSSTDNTWNLLNTEERDNKLILKLKKKRTSFNDLENRNLLLNVLEKVFLNNNIKIDWIIWLDFDERIHDHHDSYISLMREKLLTSSFQYNQFNIHMVHMWDNIHYNKIYPYSLNGIQLHTRIIRINKELIKKYEICMTNYRNKTLHFKLTPYPIREKVYPFPLLVKHLGRNSDEIRKEKYNLYTQVYDKNLINQKSYQHFLSPVDKNNLVNYNENADNIIKDIYKNCLLDE